MGVLLRAFQGGIPRGPLSSAPPLSAAPPSPLSSWRWWCCWGRRGSGCRRIPPSSMEYLMVSWESSLMAKKTIYTVYTKISKKLTNSSEKQTRMSHMPRKSVYIATLQPMSSCDSGGVLVRQINNAYNQCNCGWCITRCTIRGSKGNFI